MNQDPSNFRWWYIRSELLADPEIKDYQLVANDAVQGPDFPTGGIIFGTQGIREAYELKGEDQQQLHRESLYLSRAMAQAFNADKMNVAALGNVVPQLHVHHIVRYENDPAWPAPVWGRVPPQPYSNAQLAAVVAKLKNALNGGVEYCV